MVMSTMGFRYHNTVNGRDCWCHPECEPLFDEYGVAIITDGVHNMLVIHRDVTVSKDTQPRMTVFSR